MSSGNKLTQDRSQKQVLELALQPGNNICADCKVKNPRWASYNLGIFICMHCASIHRKIGTHITKVKSLTMDTWTKEQVDRMKNMGNVKSNAIYNPNEIRNPPPPNLEDSERDGELEQYIRGKYEYKKFIDRSALVASKLGPSRSASSLRSVTMPLAGTSSRPSTSSSLTSVSSAPAPSSPATTTLTPSAPAPAPMSATMPSQPQLSARPSVLTNAAQIRSFSQPLPSASQQYLPQQPANRGGVWDDLVSLQPGQASSTLPLQYQQTSFSANCTGLPNSTMGLSSLSSAPLTSGNNFSSGLSAGLSPSFMQQQYSSTLQTQPHSAFTTSSGFSGASSRMPSMTLPQSSFGQQLFMSQMSSQPNTSVSGLQGQYFQPQPQSATSMQMQVPQNTMGNGMNNGFLTPSPQPLMSAPVGQTQFSTTPSPGPQFLSSSAGQTQFSSTPSPGPQFLSHSPMQQQQMSMSNSPQQMMNGMNGQAQQQMMNGMNMQSQPQMMNGMNGMNGQPQQQMMNGMNGQPQQQMMNGMSGQLQQQMGGGFMGGIQQQQQQPGMLMNPTGQQMMASGMMQNQGFGGGFPIQQQWGGM